MPAVFIGHGSPANSIEENSFVEGWRAMVERIPRPKAILSISAHWYIGGLRVCDVERPRTIHDFYGFPAPMYALEYPAPGSPHLAAKVAGLLSEHSCRPDSGWGLDHGSWSPLMRMYPAADIPVIQLSIDRTRPASEHYRLGRALAPLREEGVLILGSGNIVHNLDAVDWAMPEDGEPWAKSFRARTGALLEARDDSSLVALSDGATMASGKTGADGTDQAREESRLAIPTPDHYLPLMYVLGATPGESLVFYNDRCIYGSLSMTSLLVGEA